MHTTKGGLLHHFPHSRIRALRTTGKSTTMSPVMAIHDLEAAP